MDYATPDLVAVSAVGEVKWRYRPGHPSQYPPVVLSNGNVVIYDQGSVLSATNPSVVVVWSVADVSSGINGPAGGPGDRIYLPSSDNSLHAFDRNGNLLWDQPGLTNYKPAVGPDGTVYSLCWQGLKALNPDGSERWTCTLDPINLPTHPVMGLDGKIYIMTVSGIIYAVATDGTLAWSCQVPPSLDEAPVISTDGTVYIGSYDGKLYAFGD